MTPEDEVLKAAEDILNTAQAELDLDKEELADIDAQVKELQRQRQEIRDREDKLLAYKASLDAKRRERYTRIRHAEWEVESAKRAKLLAEETKRLLEERLKQAEALDERVKDAEWQARALPHQFEAARFAAVGKRVLLADSMGLGKTLESLMALDYLGAKRVLIICPGDVMSGFNKELENWAKHRSAITIGKMPKADRYMLLDMFENRDQFTFILNYEAWYKDFNLLSRLNQMRFDTVIVDEAHTIKEITGKPYKGVSQIILAENCCYDCGGPKKSGEYYCENGHGNTMMKRSVENVMFMSGTFILNEPTEIFASLHLAYPTVFPRLKYFERDFCRRDYDGKLVWRAGGEAQLQRKIAGYYLRRTRETAGIILPKQDIIIHEIELDPEVYTLQAEIIRMLNEDAAIKINEGKVSKMMDLLALITRNRQAAIWPGGIVLKEPRFDEFGDPVMEFDFKKMDFVQVIDEYPVGENFRQSVKMDKAQELIKELNADGHRVVVFSQFKEALKELGNRLGENSIQYHGDTSDKVRDQIKANFDRSYGEEKKWDNVLCHYKTGGIGLNLTAATACVILDENWNPGTNSQAYDRINRMGQTDETQVHILRLANGIDVWMASLIERKREMIGNFDDAAVVLDVEAELRKLLGGK